MAKQEYQVVSGFASPAPDGELLQGEHVGDRVYLLLNVIEEEETGQFEGGVGDVVQVAGVYKTKELAEQALEWLMEDFTEEDKKLYHHKICDWPIIDRDLLHPEEK
jgi:hypothetical protein